MYNPSAAQGGDNYSEWIELYNPAEQAVNLSGWTLGDVDLLAGFINHSDGKSYNNETMEIPAKGYAVVTDGGSGTWVYENFSVDPAAIALHVDADALCGGLDNNGDTITLKKDTLVIDNVTYTDVAAEGKTLERNETGWYESKVEGGTPGKINRYYSFGVNITADKTEKTTTANVNATFVLSVKNTGNVVDTFNLTYTNPDTARVGLSRGQIMLAPLVTGTVLLNVTGAIENIYRVNVTAASQGNESVVGYVNTTTTVESVTTKPAPRRGGGQPRDTDGDGYGDIDEKLAGTDPNDPCDPNPECAACLAVRAPTPAPVTPTPTLTPLPAVTLTPGPASTPVTPTSAPVHRISLLVLVLIVIAVVVIAGIIIIVQRRK